MVKLKKEERGVGGEKGEGGGRRRKGEKQNKINKGEGRQLRGEPAVSCPHSGKEISDKQKENSHTCPQERSEGDKKTGAVSKQRNKQSAGQHHEAGGCGERRWRERERAHPQAGPGAGWRAGLGVVKGPGDEKFRSGFLQKSSAISDFHSLFPLKWNSGIPSLFLNTVGTSQGSASGPHPGPRVLAGRLVGLGVAMEERDYLRREAEMNGGFKHQVKREEEVGRDQCLSQCCPR